MAGPVARRDGFIVRISGIDGSAGGLGCLISSNEVITSTHVIDAALGRDSRAQDVPDSCELVLVDFPLLRGTTPVRALVARWWAPPGTPPAGELPGDLARLVIEPGGLPPGVLPAVLAGPAAVRSGASVTVFGHPGNPGRSDGAGVALRIRRTARSGLLQLDAGSGGVDLSGYSGAPLIVADGGSDAVAGIITLASTEGKDALAVPASMFRAGRPAPAAPEQAAGLRGDVPAQDDTLGRHALADLIAERLRQFSKKEAGISFLIHLDGPWGSGKSTLLNMLRKDLKQDPSWLVVDFNAWQQSRVGASWWALMSALRHDMSTSRRLPSRVWLRLTEISALFRRAGARYYLAALILVVVSGVVFVVLNPRHFTLAYETGLAQSITAIAAAVTTLFVGALAASRFMLWDSARGARLYEQSNSNPMEGIARHFNWLIARAGQPVVFFIEDLDRCPDTYVVELLEAAQTLVRDAPRQSPAKSRKPDGSVSFVVAAEGAWLRQSYEIAYSQLSPAISEPGRPLGHLFLDKLFQLRVPMPTVDSTRMHSFVTGPAHAHLPEPQADDLAWETELVSWQLVNSHSEPAIMRILRSASPLVRREVAATAVKRLSEPEVSAETERSLEKFWPLLAPNPRTVKLFLNDYGILRAVRLFEGIPVDTDPLALWAVLETRWPALADFLRVRPDCVELAGIPATGPRFGGIPEAIRDLLSDAAVLAVINFQDGGPLSAEVIRQCCGIAAGYPATEDEP